MSPRRPLVADHGLGPAPVESNQMLVAQFQLLFANDLKLANLKFRSVLPTKILSNGHFLTNLDVADTMAVVAFSPENIAKPIRIIPNDVHPMMLVDENQSIDS